MKKHTLFHGGLYLEILRRLLTATIVMFTLVTVFESFFILLNSSFNGWDPTFLNTFREAHVSAYILPFAAPPLLMFIAFRCLTSRKDSDFYHSLPLTKRSVAVSSLAAVMTMLTALTVLSAAVVALVMTADQQLRYPVYTLFTDTAASLLACFYVTAILFFAASLCGTTVTAVFAGATLLIAPRTFFIFLFELIAETANVLPYDMTDIPFGEGSLLFFGTAAHDFVITSVATVVYLLLGLWLSKRRPSETAENPTVSPILHTVLRIVLCMLCCLPAIPEICDTYCSTSTVIFYYLVALAVYFLFELFTTKRAKNLLKAIPWLAVVIILNIAVIGGVFASAYAIATYAPPADRIDSVSLIRINSMNYNGTKSAFFDDQIEVIDFNNEYARLDCAAARLSDDKSRQIVSNALNDAAEYVRNNNDLWSYNPREASPDNDVVTYSVNVKIVQNGLPRYRRIVVYESELMALFKEINTREPLPQTVRRYFS